MTQLPSRIHALAAVFVVSIIFPCLLTAQSSNPCADAAAQKDWDSTSSPVYADAMQLAHTLNGHGVVVNCIRRSKEENMFAGEKGAAWFQTREGAFEAWFLPKAQTFAKLEIVAMPEGNGRYVYSFKGTPQIATKLDSSKQVWFIKHDNVLLKILGEQRLADDLDHALR